MQMAGQRISIAATHAIRLGRQQKKSTIIQFNKYVLLKGSTHRGRETVAKINFEGATFKNSFAGKRVTLADGAQFIKSNSYPYNWERLLSNQVWRKVGKNQWVQLQAAWDAQEEA